MCDRRHRGIPKDRKGSTLAGPGHRGTEKGASTNQGETNEESGTGKPPKGAEAKLGKSKNRGKQRGKASKKAAVAADLDLDDPATRGRVFQRAPAIEDWVNELKAEGFSEFYSRPVTNELLEAKQPGGKRLRADDRIQPRGTKDFGEGGLGKVLKKAFPSGGPDLVAVNHETHQILVGDITASSKSTAKLKINPGDKRRLPNELQNEEERVHHLEKTKRDAKSLASRLKGAEYENYEIAFQDYYREDPVATTSKRFVYKPKKKPASVASTTTAKAPQKGKTKKPAKGKSRSKPKVKSSSGASVKQTKGAIKPIKKAPAAKKATSEAVTAEKNLALKRGVGDRGLGSTATELKTAGKELAAVEPGVSAGRKISRAARLFSLTKTVGKFAVAVFLPLSFLDLAFEIALWIFESDQKRRAADKEEWDRIINFLVGYEGSIDVPFVNKYKLGINDLIQKLINQRLTDRTYSLNFLHWFNRWESNKGWVGFVYAKIDVTLMRQELTYVHPDTENRIRYFLNNNRPDISFAQLALFSHNSKIVTEIGDYMPQDANNLFTGGENNDPNRVYRALKEQNKNIGEPGEKYFEEMDLYSISVAKASNVKVKYVVPSPALTPFDFVIFKCRNLIIEILQFIAKYEQYFMVDMPFDNIWGVNWYEDMQFSYPINTENVHWCIDSLYWIIEKLSTHTADYDDKTTEGKDRRWRILADIIPPNSNKRILRDISNSLYHIVSDLDEQYLIDTRDPDLDYITYDYLSNSAAEIESDLKRMLADLTSSNKARAYAYEYRGDLETD